MSIEVGTASWTDATLIKSGRFYPKGCTSAEARLRFYSSQFPMVEVDASYYAMPSAATSALWAERTPEHFTFNFKAFRLFTGHQTERKFFPPDIQPLLPQSDKKNLYYRDDLHSAARQITRAALRRPDDALSDGIRIPQCQLARRPEPRIDARIRT